MTKLTSHGARLRRHRRVRSKITGIGDRPRLSVFRSSVHIYAQVIDDVKGETLVSASTVDAEVKAQLDGKTKTAESELVGRVLAARALSKGITSVVFDRGGFIYHGRIKALADGARAAGLQF